MQTYKITAQVKIPRSVLTYNVKVGAESLTGAIHAAAAMLSPMIDSMASALTIRAEAPRKSKRPA